MLRKFVDAERGRKEGFPANWTPLSLRKDRKSPVAENENQIKEKKK